MSIISKILFLTLFYFLSCIANAQHKNILISDHNEPEEVTICINPKVPSQITAGANIDNYYFSSDTGKTWRSGVLKSSFGVWGDPCIVVDTSGCFYYFHLSNPTNGSWIDRTVCQKSCDGGISWSNGTYSGLNGKKAQDKHWAAVDPKTNNIYVTWTEFDDYGSKSQKDSTRILFTSSFDAGKTWTDPVRVSENAGTCVDDDKTVEGAVPCVGTAGEIYVSWSGNESIHFDKSLDSGKTWLDKDILVSEMPGGWDFKIPGFQRCNGMPVTCCDVSNSPFRGTIYINWADQRNGKENTDVWIAESADGGNTWSSPKRVNCDSSKNHQFLTWMAIDQVNGNIFIVYYDRRNYDDNTTDVFLAYSNDGGETFHDTKINNRSFIPNSYVFMGDYNNISAYNNIVRPIWGAMDQNMRLSIWTALIDVPLLLNGK